MSDVYCPKGKRSGKEIMCTLSGKLCGNVFFCEPANKWKNTDAALKCPLLRKEKENG